MLTSHTTSLHLFTDDAIHCRNEHCVGGRLQYRSCCVQVSTDQTVAVQSSAYLHCLQECVDSVTADHDFVQQQCLAFPGLQADLAG